MQFWPSLLIKTNNFFTEEIINSNVDINIAPLYHMIYNEVKSENKLVKFVFVNVQTISDNFWAFKKRIILNETEPLSNLFKIYTAYWNFILIINI